MKLSTKLWLLLSLIVIISLSTCSSYVYHKVVDLHNNAERNYASNEQITQQYIALYDAKFLTFKGKTDVANINKETFIKVTEIIMSNRKDGQNLAWKWVSENQPIPFGEFTVFYKDLSDFVGTQYNELYSLKYQRQMLVKDHNYMLKEWPNNLFNTYLNKKPLQYRDDYISDSTKKVLRLQ